MSDTPDTEEINVDELLSEIEAPTPERPMTEGEETPTPEAETPPEPIWNGQEWEFEWNGKKVAPDSRDKAKIWMSQGYNYSQRMGELNKTHAQKMAELEAKAKSIAELEGRYSPYAKVDEYAQKNREWWEYVQKQWEEKQSQAPQLDPNLRQVIQPLEEKLGKFEQYFSQIEQQQQEKVIQEQDHALESEIEAIRKDHPNIDLTSVDPASGETLELRILKHAQSSQLPSFKAAFWDYLGPKLIQEARAAGREQVAKDAQSLAKKGILGKTPAPIKAVKPTSVKGKSYDALLQEAKQELGLS